MSFPISIVAYKQIINIHTANKIIAKLGTLVRTSKASQQFAVRKML